MDSTIPLHWHKLIEQSVWDNWSHAQRSYCLALENQHCNRRYYYGKIWKLGQHRPEFRESCPKCRFEYCFYAEPRNFSYGDADALNLMKCADATCQHEFESNL